MSDTCFSCGAPITWVVTPAGRRMPVEAAPLVSAQLRGLQPNATVVLVDREGNGDSFAALQALGMFDDARHTIHISHFASCPFATAHRRRPPR